jgi:hypothetical protein
MSVDSRSSYGMYLLSAKAEGFIHPHPQGVRFSETNPIKSLKQWAHDYHRQRNLSFV